MNKAKLLKWVNIVLMISATIQIVDILILIFGLFPEYSRLIYVVHVNNGKVFISLIFIHVYLNWGWIRANFLKKR